MAVESDCFEGLSSDDQTQWQSDENGMVHVLEAPQVLDLQFEQLADNGSSIVAEALDEIDVCGVEHGQGVEQPFDGGAAVRRCLEALGGAAEALLDGLVDLADEHGLGRRFWTGEWLDLRESRAVGFATPHGDHELFGEPVEEKEEVRKRARKVGQSCLRRQLVFGKKYQPSREI